MRIFQNEGGKFFRYISPDSELENLSRPFSGWSAGFIDYNNDGWKDIYNANGDVDDLGPNARQHDTMFENVLGKELHRCFRADGQRLSGLQGFSAAPPSAI
ncbi:MAG: VCBS repeat-containing protein [Pyrinomonadaceae bacterium]